MKLAATFIEYLITGYIALFCIGPKFIGIDEVSKPFAVVASLSVACVLGMLIDTLSKFLIRHWQRKIRCTYNLPASEINPPTMPASVFLTFHSIELAKELQWRSSRDRIARGAIINSIILTFRSIFDHDAFLHFKQPCLTILAGLVLIGLCALTWRQYEVSSCAFEKSAKEIIKHNSHGKKEGNRAGNSSNDIMAEELSVGDSNGEESDES